MKKDPRFIVEHGLSGRVEHSVAGCNTVEDLDRYLKQDPHPKHRLVNFQWNNGSYTLVWEKK